MPRFLLSGSPNGQLADLFSVNKLTIDVVAGHPYPVTRKVEGRAALDLSW